MPLAVSLLTGVGLEGLGSPLGNHLGDNLGDSLVPKGGSDAIYGVWGDFTLVESRLHTRMSVALAAAVQECRGMGGMGSGQYTLDPGSTGSQKGPLGPRSEVPLGVSALCWPYYDNHRASGIEREGNGGGGRERGARGVVEGGVAVERGEEDEEEEGGGGGEETPSDPVTRLALGLLHVAAMLGGAGEAETILAHRYLLGIGLPLDVETAAQYALRASAVSSEAFHRVGGQPIMEGDRIDDDTEKEVAKGKSGNEDELIQHQIVRAAEGDVAAMIATGDLYYYGARGTYVTLLCILSLLLSSSSISSLSTPSSDMFLLSLP